jgi:preprotein translocase subunit SecF
MNVIGYRKIFLGVAIFLVAAAAAAVGYFGFRQGIDMSGGALVRFRVGEGAPPVSELQNVFRDDLKIGDARINYDSRDGVFTARYPVNSNLDHAKLVQTFREKYPSWEEMSFQTTSPSVGRDLRRKSLIAVVLALLAISLYIAYAFRKVYRPVSSWKYGVVTLITLLHDVAIPAGLLAALGRFQGVEVDGNFVVALLVIMGFSVHDTIVVFDRIRENLLLDRGKTDFGQTVNASVNQTMARSINTSLTLILVLLALYFAGPATLKYFILTLLAGVSVGVYSSIFVASPLLYVWQGFRPSPPEGRGGRS